MSVNINMILMSMLLMIITIIQAVSTQGRAVMIGAIEKQCAT